MSDLSKLQELYLQLLPLLNSININGIKELGYMIEYVPLSQITCKNLDTGLYYVSCDIGTIISLKNNHIIYQNNILKQIVYEGILYDVSPDDEINELGSITEADILYLKLKSC